MRVRRALAGCLFLGFGVLASCSRHSNETGPDASAAPAASPAPPLASEEPGNDEIKPVYPADAGPPDPLAARLCEAIDVLPAKRAAECCATRAMPIGSILAGQCSRTLTSALGAHAVTLAEADVKRCVDAVTQATSGCDWVTATASAPLPPECDGIVKGAVAAGAPCRSSLECPDGLRCQGLSTVDVGTCAAPKASGSACSLANDMLATFTRQDRMDRAHPECSGYCRVRQCKDTARAGAACKGDVECGKGRCERGTCTTAPPPATGQPCTEACAAGDRCVKGVCVAPKAEGATCEADGECRGACVRGDAGAGGTCSKTCVGSPKMVPRPPGAP